MDATPRFSAAYILPGYWQNQNWWIKPGGRPREHHGRVLQGHVQELLQMEISFLKLFVLNFCAGSVNSESNYSHYEFQYNDPPPHCVVMAFRWSCYIKYRSRILESTSVLYIKYVFIITSPSTNRQSSQLHSAKRNSGARLPG